MNKRIIVPLSVCLLLFIAVAFVGFSGPSSVILEGRSRWTKLRAGMSEAEFEAILGVPTARWGRHLLYWDDEKQWYEIRSFLDPDEMVTMQRGEKICDRVEWAFVSGNSWGQEALVVGAFIEQGMVSSFWSGESRQNRAERWVRRTGTRFSLDTSLVSHYQYGPRGAIPPWP
jgi:hypothetical protein